MSTLVTEKQQLSLCIYAVCACIHACSIISVHTHTHTHTHIYIHACMHTYIHTYIYAYIHIYSQVCLIGHHLYMYTCVCVRVCMCVCVCVCVQNIYFPYRYTWEIPVTYITSKNITVVNMEWLHRENSKWSYHNISIVMFMAIFHVIYPTDQLKKTQRTKHHVRVFRDS